MVSRFGRVNADSQDTSRRWKDTKRDEGDGNADGIVLSLDMIGDGLYDAAYVITTSVGQNAQQLSLQVDTGSSDLWIASTSCSTQACTAGKPQLYDPSSSTPTGQEFSIDYLSGQASGPIVWDKFVLGGYEIDDQALAAASSVSSEPLQSSFSGLLGLSLPLNSVIAELIPPVTSNNPDGAPWASNLFGITPTSSAPSQPFLSLSLSRPGSNTIPSYLGIGRHPSEIVSDPKEITYSTLSPDQVGDLYWKVEVRAINVYVGGAKMEVVLGHGAAGGAFPLAVLDSGVPRILATPALASGIWGALGINPASDGNFYVPCTTPLNMSITLVDQSEIPLHPLDLSAISQDDPSSSTCVGLIQQEPSLDNPESVADIILGVPFLRSVYMVMAYQVPDPDGTIGTGEGEDVNIINPRLGLLNLTNPTQALAEFNTVRVDNEPLSSTPSSNSSSSGGSSSDVASKSSGSGISVGLEVLFALLGFVALCAILFGARWVVMRRKYRSGSGDATPAEWEMDKKTDGYGGRGGGLGMDDGLVFDELGLVRTGSASHVASEDTQKTLRFGSYGNLKTRESWIHDGDVDVLGGVERTNGDEEENDEDVNEFGFPRRRPPHDRTYSGVSISVVRDEDSTQDDTLVGRPGDSNLKLNTNMNLRPNTIGTAHGIRGGSSDLLILPSSDSPYPTLSPRARSYSNSRHSPSRDRQQYHHHHASSTLSATGDTQGSPDSPGVTFPLLAHSSHSSSHSQSPSQSQTRPSMHHRGYSSQSSNASARLDDLVELGIGMAGVGARGRRRTMSEGLGVNDEDEPAHAHKTSVSGSGMGLGLSGVVESEIVDENAMDSHPDYVISGPAPPVVSPTLINFNTSPPTSNRDSASNFKMATSPPLANPILGVEDERTTDPHVPRS